jgi:MFS family permease
VDSPEPLQITVSGSDLLSQLLVYVSPAEKTDKGQFQPIIKSARKKQFALRTALLYSGSQLGNAFGPLLAIAILELDGAHGLQGWRWLL